MNFILQFRLSPALHTVQPLVGLREKKGDREQEMNVINLGKMK